MPPFPRASALAVLTALAIPALRAQDASPDLTARTDALFTRWDRADSPGCAVAVVRDGALAYSAGFGSALLEHQVPITPETVFYIGSVSKQFVTVCVALLEERGALGFDDEVREHIPEFPRYDHPVTVRHLIHHTSGIRDYFELWDLAGRDYLDYMPEQAVLDTICRQRELNFEPGSRHLYSNSCYFLLGILVERVAGQSLREFAAENVFGPLGMDDSRFHDDVSELIPKRAPSYFRAAADGEVRNFVSRFDLVGSGGVYSTVLDLAKWNANFDRNVLGKGGPELLDTMRTRGVLNDGTQLDYAFALVHGTHRGAKTIGHSGSLAGYRAQFLRFPDHDLSVVILCNLASMQPGRLARQVADRWLGDELGRAQATEAASAGERRTDDATRHASVDPAERDALAGDYWSEELEVTYRLRADAEGLTVAVGYREPYVLMKRSDGTWAGRGAVFQFTRSENGGKATGFEVSNAGVEHLRFARR